MAAIPARTLPCTTIASMRRRWEYKVRPEFGDRFAGELTEMDWQRWIDQLTRQGLSRSSIAQLVSLASGIYAWAAAPSRRLVRRNPLRLVELPPNDEETPDARRARARSRGAARRPRARGPPSQALRYAAYVSTFTAEQSEDGPRQRLRASSRQRSVAIRRLSS